MIMTDTQALEIIQKYCDNLGLSLLEGLQEMDRTYNDLWGHEQRAFRVSMQGFRQLMSQEGV